MMRCKDVSRLLLAGEAERLGWRGRMGVWLHLALCAMCRRLRRQIAQMSAGAKGLGGEPDGELEERLLRRLRGPTR